MKLSPTSAANAVKHAQAMFPDEACGLVVVKRGRQKYIPCQNIASKSEDAFVISASEYASAEAQGEVVAVFHSHPNATAQPSAHDRSACRASGVTWHILAIPSMEWFELSPQDTPRQAPLYGREFVHGSDDCYGFVRAWFLQERGIELPEFVRSDNWWKDGENLYMDNFAKVGFVQISPEQIQPGDALLMQVCSDVPNHAAIYLGNDQIGHHLYGRLSSREIWGGYYKKHTTHVLRYSPNAA